MARRYSESCFKIHEVDKTSRPARKKTRFQPFSVTDAEGDHKPNQIKVNYLFGFPYK